MRLRRLHPRFGLVVDGMDLRDFNDITITEIRGFIERHGVVVFPGQLLQDQDLVAIGTAVGCGRLEPSSRRISHGRTIKEVVHLGNLRYEDGVFMGFPGNDTDFWHSDQEYRENPATLASLYCVIPCAKGGNTSFGSTDTRHLGLDATDLAFLETAWSTRIPASTHDNVPNLEIAHRALLTAPASGRRFVYASENLIRFLDTEPEIGDALRGRILDAMLQPENIYSHQWAMGDFIIYDNAQIIHRREAFEGPRLLKATKIYADPDYFAVPRGRIVADRGARKETAA